MKNLLKPAGIESATFRPTHSTLTTELQRSPQEEYLSCSKLYFPQQMCSSLITALATVYCHWLGSPFFWLLFTQLNQVSYVYWTVHHLDSWVKGDQLDIICFILRMDVLTSETCWALNKEIIKQVTSSWSLFTQLNQVSGPPLWSTGQSFWLQIQRSRVRSPALPDFLSSSGSTQPREVKLRSYLNKKVAAPGSENRD